MATTENMGLMTYIDESGNKFLLYPITKPECVDGLSELLAGKAPAGYGLGTAEELPDGTDLNTVVSNGWYFWSGSVENAPPVGNLIRVWTHVPGSCMQETVALGNGANWGTWLRRMVYKNGEGTMPWEYINPPMVAGIEYRTTERWNGNPVYTKLFNIGGFTGVKNTSLTNGNLLIRAECVYLQDGKYCIATPYAYDYSTSTIIEINLGSGVACDDAWFTAWYIKG